MVPLIIRDDDYCYFTHPEDIEKVYAPIPDFPVTFAVVPQVTDVLGGCPDTKGNETPKPLGENTELMDFLKERIARGCDIVMHGITHGYQPDDHGRKMPEMIWRNGERDLTERIRENKLYLEGLFERNISCFVAPSNQIRKEGLRAVCRNGMNYSGIIPTNFQRELNVRSLRNYVKRMWVSTVRRLPYPGVLTYATHQELNAINANDYDYLRRVFAYCDRFGLPMAVGVHYWQLRDHPERFRRFFDFVRYAVDHGAQPSRLSDQFQTV